MSKQQKIEAELAWILGFERHVATVLHQTDLDHTPRSIAAGTLYHLTFETATSITALTRDGRTGSAMALIRVTIESYIRGSWLHHCASIQSLKNALSGNEVWAKLGLDKMTGQLQTSGPTQVSNIIGMMDQYVDRGIRHSLAHGGSQHILGRFDGKRIGAVYSNENIVAMLRLATVAMCASGFGAADLASKPDAKDTIARLFGVLVENSVALEGGKLNL